MWWVQRIVTGSLYCTHCSLRNSCTYCGAIFGDNTIFEKVPFYNCLLHHTCHLESRSKRLTFLNKDTVNQIKSDHRHREDLLWLKRCLEILNSPGLTVTLCKFLVFNIIKISQKLGDVCDHIFERGFSELGGQYMIENITQAGCVGGKIDIRKRHGPHRNFLKLYNQTYELQSKGKHSRIITSLANNWLSFFWCSAPKP